MKLRFAPKFPELKRQASAEGGSARTIVVVLVAFLLGLGSAFWYFHAKQKATTGIAEAGTPRQLSDATKAILAGLKSPIAIHFYSILDPATVSEATQAFAGRVDELLTEYQDAANGKITVTRYTAASANGPNAASADGIKAFNLAKGNACFLGIAVLGNDQKETLAQLSPEWEAALESDLSHAIGRVSSPKPAAGITAFKPAPDQTATEEVKRALPNLSSLTVEQGSTILREAAMKEAQDALQQMKGKIQGAQERLAQARTGGSAAEQQAALKELQQLQSEQAQTIKDITGRLQDQIEALKQLKSE